MEGADALHGAQTGTDDLSTMSVVSEAAGMRSLTCGKPRLQRKCVLRDSPVRPRDAGNVAVASAVVLDWRD